MQINTDKLETSLQDLKGILKDGLLAVAIWDSSTGLALAEINPQPAGVALFNELTGVIQSTLAGSGFPGLRRYYFLDLEADHSIFLLRHGDDLLQGLLMNSSKANLGILLSVALPKMLASVQAARG